MYTLTNVDVKDVAICTLTSIDGELSVKAPKEMFNRKTPNKSKVKMREKCIIKKDSVTKMKKLETSNVKIYKFQSSKAHIS